MLAWELELLGVYVSEHPFSGAVATVAKHTSALISEISVEMDGREVVIAGMVNDVRQRVTKAGKPFLVVTVEDLSGSQEITVWSDVAEPTRDLWVEGNILLMLVRVRERGDRLQISVNQVSLVQAADGSVSHEAFAIPPWLTDAVRDAADVSVVAVRHGNGDANGNGTRRANGDSHGGAGNSGAGGNGHAIVDAPVAAAEIRQLRFFLHESDDPDADRARLDGLIALIERYPGDDTVRLFIHAQDDDKIELNMPRARVCEELRDEGVALLGDHGGADAIEALVPPRAASARRTRGVEPLEVV
jgi:DNA polymerase-3 subunit alpha